MFDKGTVLFVNYGCMIRSGNAGTGKCQRGAFEHGCEFAPVAGTDTIYNEILSAPCRFYVASVVDGQCSAPVKATERQFTIKKNMQLRIAGISLHISHQFFEYRSFLNKTLLFRNHRYVSIKRRLTMKFISWNVNGLRACVNKGFLDFFHEINADAFCIQETKLQEGQIDLSLPGYYQYWNYAKKKGYSGTAIFTKKEPLSVSYGIGIPEHDEEGRVITLEYENYYLITCYTPNSQNELARLSYRMEWEDAFLQYLKGLEEKKPVIFCGDLNVAHKEIDLKNPKTNRKNAGFTDEEREKFSVLLENGFIDTFRYFYPEQEGIYSWWSYRFHAREKNAGWRIDYFLISQSLKEKLKGAAIHTEVLGSDHCPVELEIDC